MTNEKNKICEMCGKEFSCGAKPGKCWCFEIELAPENLAELERDFENCLCRDCLTALKPMQILSE